MGSHTDRHDVGLVATDLDAAVADRRAGLVGGDPVARRGRHQFVGQHEGGPGVLGEGERLKVDEGLEIIERGETQLGAHRRAAGWP